ncbi:kinase-like domain-containing protein [Rhodocollybia butyracea]|uniref:Kinase-like domain-containing protein n=1 Tax=Rhodocollybia butyracea TaxID=206335 RepID=A0A9P5PKA5_9AGAR|nr:kinase-like domain-containing protein [Rhodocollybia butyracea]
MISATAAELRNVLNAHPNSNQWMKDLLGLYEVLDEKSLQHLVDLIQSELDLSTECVDLAISDSSRFHRRCLQALRYISTRYRTLPSSLVIYDVQRKGQRPVGGGGFADIWEGILGNQKVCLKVLRLLVEPDEQVREKTRRRFCNEAIIWKQLKHPNILPLLGVNVTLFEPSFCLISPWMKNKDVITFLRHNPSHSRHKTLQEISAGLLYLHSRNPPITHGDIRGANILITSDFRCCLADFGLALVTANSESLAASTTSNMKGAIRWMAPELFSDLAEGVILDHPSRDIYAFGCTIVEIISLQHPFHDLKTDYQVLTSLISGKRPARPQSYWCTDPLWHLTTSCWTQSPSDRPKAYNIYMTLQQDVQDNIVSEYHAILSPRAEKVSSDDKIKEEWDKMEMAGFGNQPSSVDTVKGGNMGSGSPSLSLSLPSSMGSTEMQQQLDGQPQELEHPKAYVHDDSTLPGILSSHTEKENNKWDKTQMGASDYEKRERNVDAEEGDTLVDTGLGGDNEDDSHWVSEDESDSVQVVAVALNGSAPPLNPVGTDQPPPRFQLLQRSRRFQFPHRSQPSCRFQTSRHSQPSRRFRSPYLSQPSRRFQPLRRFQPSRYSQPSRRFKSPHRSQPSRHSSGRKQQSGLQQMLRDADSKAERHITKMSKTI